MTETILFKTAPFCVTARFLDMNKRAVFLLLAAGAVFCLFGCASNNFSFTDTAQVAISGVEGSPSVFLVDENYITDEDSGGIISNTVNKLLYSDNPEIYSAQDRVDFAEQYLRQALETIANVKTVEKETVVNNQTYKQNVNPFSYANTNAVASGYKKDSLTFGRKVARKIMRETGSSSIVSLYFEFDKKFTQKPTGKYVSAVIKMRANIMDQTGKLVVFNDLIEESAESIKCYSGANYDKEEFVQLYPQIIENAINRFVLEYVK